MPDERLIVDGVSHRSHAAAVRAEASGLSIQNIGGILCQVDDQGNVTPLLGGVLGGITNLTGDVVATGPGTVSATIQSGVVTYAKIQNVSANSFLGNPTGAPTSIEEISAATAKTMLGLAAIATSGSAGDLTSGTLPAGRFPALTGDVTTVAGSLATTVNIPATLIPFGDASNHMTTSAKLSWLNGTGTEALTIQGTGPSGVLALNLRNTTNGSCFAGINAYWNGTTPIGALLFGHSTTPANVGTFTLTQSTVNAPDQFAILGTSVATIAPFVVFTQLNDVVLGNSIKMAATATQGYVWLPTSAIPTGVPAFDGNFGGYTGQRKAIVVDDSNHRLYAYLGNAWHYASFDDGAGSGGLDQLTGDVLAGPGTGTQAATIAANAVTLAKFQQVATATLIGRGTAGTGNVEVLTLGAGLSISGGVITSTGTGITTLVGDVGASGTGTVAATIQPNAVSLAKFQTIATGSLLGRSTAGTGNVEVISVGSGLTLSGGVLTSTSTGGTITALTGDVTASGSGSVVATIAAGAVTTSKIAALNITTGLLAAAAVTTAKIASNAVTYALIQTQADQTILGNVSGGTAVPSALTKAQVDALLFGGLSSGIMGVTGGTGAVGSSPLTTTCVLYGTGPSTIGQDVEFTWDAAGHVLSVPTVSAVSTGSLTLKTASGVVLTLNNGPTTVTVAGGIVVTGTTGGPSFGEALAFTKTGDQAITKLGGTFTIGTLDNQDLVFVVNGGNLAQIDATSGFRHSSVVFPAIDVTYDLGTSAATWNTLWVKNIARNGAPASLVLTGAGFNVDSNSTGAFSVTHQGTNGRFWSDVNGILFFPNVGGSPAGVAQQTGGAATAGAVYTSTEQTMLNRVYNALRAYQLIT